MSANLQAPYRVPDDAYGQSTQALNDILRIAEGIQLFVPVRSVALDSYKLLHEHIARYKAATGDDPPMAAAAVVLGDGEALDMLRKDIDLEPRSEQFADRWTARLGRVLQATIEGLSETEKHSRFKPPLWPIQGMPNVVHQLIVYSRDRILVDIEPAGRDAFWELACDIEDLFWNALQWEVVYADGLRTNPYYPLLILSGHGIYPLGLLRRALIGFGRARVPFALSHLVDPSRR